MKRTLLTVLLCLAVGAGGMWVASNFRVKFETVGGGEPPPTPTTAAKPEAAPPVASLPPEKLPAHLLPPVPTPVVQQASGTLPLAVGATATAAGVGVDLTKLPDARTAIAANPIEIVELLDGTTTDAILYTGADLNASSVLLRGDTVILNFRFGNQADLLKKTGSTGAQLKLQILATADGSTKPVVAEVADASATTVTLALTGTEFTNKRKVTLSAQWVDSATPAVIEPIPTAFRLSPSRVESKWEVLLPTNPPPEIKNVYNGYYAAPQTSSVSLFPGFARVEVASKRSGADHTFLLYGDTPARRTLQATPRVVTSKPGTTAGTTEYTLKWDAAVSGTPLLLVRETVGNSAHSTDSKAVTITAAPTFPKRITLDQNRLTPVIKGVDQTPLVGPINDRFHLGTDTAKLTVALDTPPQAGKVLLFVNKLVGTFPVADDEAASNASVTFNAAKFPNDGDHVVTVAFEAGGVLSPTPLTLNVKVRRGGLSVVRVTPTDFSNATDYQVRVAFNPDNPVDPATAATKAHYTLTLNGTNSSAQILSDPVPFDPVTNTATLQLSPALAPGLYTLTVVAAVKAGTGGIKDIYGNPLGGVFGEDGKSAGFSLMQPVGGNQPSQSAGVVGGGAPYVTYPEYTKFRQLTDGFNPSDRVETRVVRLYYSRDAHHVAEVVNRNARSWNSMSVDVRRRAADLSRDTANAATDSRKRLEGDSVQSATETRAAEGRLRDLQAKLTAARAEAATATTQLGRVQQQLEQSQRTAGRDQTNVGVRRDIDASTDAAQTRLDRLTAEVTQAEAVVTTAKRGTSERPADLDTPTQTARQTLDASQQDFRLEFANRRASAERTTTVTNAAADVTNLEVARRRPGLSPEQLARLDADLSAAVQKRDDAIQTEVLRADTGGVLRTKLTKAQTDQLEVERLVNAREALTALPTIRAAQTDARRDLDRAKAVAGGRAATDTGTDASLDTARQQQTDIRTLNAVVANSRAVQQSLEAEIVNAAGDVQAKRAKEVELNLRVRESEQRELRGREGQFRQETAAAKADPNTFAPGKPESVDPVEQCSVSVIGEGLIQIRGPVKGLNVIRTMINQLDSPTGQVRVGVHTFQVNGEKADRMDRVSQNIQRYLEHSKFLTTQSAQMLRKAVTLVASRKAHEASLTIAPGCTKAEMEMKYLHCFFGKDFIDELRQLDSEFLRSGNKLLSLHSMDSTSLSSAMFLLALAKNDIRAEILAEWQAQLQTKLPEAEMTFYAAGLVCAERCEAHHDRKFCVLAQNAKFASFLGFFDAEVQGADTITPVQREFVRLAQIFKTRLVTEMELKQRVMERTLLEDRLGNYLDELRETKAREDEANKSLRLVQAKMQTAIAGATVSFSRTEAIQQLVESELEKQDKAYDQIFTAAGYQFPSNGRGGVFVVQPQTPNWRPSVELGGTQYYLPEIWRKEQAAERLADGQTSGADDMVSIDATRDKWFLDRLRDTRRYLYQFYYVGTDKYRGFKETVEALDDMLTTKSFPLKTFTEFHGKFKTVLGVIRENVKEFQTETNMIVEGLRKDKPDVSAVITRFDNLRSGVLGSLREGEELRKQVQAVFTSDLDGSFNSLRDSFVKQQAAQRQATLARRPLDEKKMLDMLVDEMEDKYIELLDGTRAHTANVDNYLKALATALDDDFNTQFYQPAFRRIRSVAVTSRDVALGQIESTTVLTNNRMLGKVSPAASMEFDLPRRDILVKEAFKGAKAAVQDYGALLNDPIFLDMVKLYGGLPPSATFGGAGGGLSAVRNVLPGLPSSADEMLLAQAGSPRREFGTNLSSLVPDPAIYKFETGTGYEVRPVISPDGQAVVFAFDYMYTTDVREPVRADEKHLGRVKRHFVHTDVQLGNYELREVSKYWVTLKASRTGQGVPLLQDIPGVGALFRPQPSASSSLQQNLIYSQAAIFPTLFDLMGLRYAPAIADIDPEHTKNDEFVVRGRRDYLRQFIFDYGASRVDDALRIMYGERRTDLYRSQHTIPWVHPNGHQGPGLRQRDAELQEGYEPVKAYPPTKFAPGMHAPLPTGRDPYGDPFADPYGDPGRPLPPGGYGPPPLSAKPPTTGYGAMREYEAKPYGTTVTPTVRPPATTFNDLPPPRLASPTVSPPAPRPTTPAPVPARPTAAPLEPQPLTGRVGVNTNPYVPR